MKRRSFIVLGLLAAFAPGLVRAQTDKVKESMVALVVKTKALGMPKIEGTDPVGGKDAPGSILAQPRSTIPLTSWMPSRRSTAASSPCS
jgi:hypothetical protein